MAEYRSHGPCLGKGYRQSSILILAIGPVWARVTDRAEYRSHGPWLGKGYRQGCIYCFLCACLACKSLDAIGPSGATIMFRLRGGGSDVEGKM